MRTTAPTFVKLVPDSSRASNRLDRGTAEGYDLLCRIAAPIMKSRSTRRVARIRRAARTALGAMLLLGLLGMGGCWQRGATDGPVKLVFWHAWGGHEGKYLEQLVAEFNDTHADIQVQPAYFLIGDKLMAAIAGGIPPDVATVWDWMLPTMGEAGCFVSLNDHLAHSGIARDDYLPNIWEYGMFGDTKYGVPTALNVWMIFFNKELFREVGLDPGQPPSSIDELTESAQRLARRLPTGRLERIGFVPEFQYTYIWMWNFGGRLYDAETRRFVINSAQNRRALEWIVSFYREYGVDDYRRFVATFGEYDSPDNPFYKERLAMREDGQWQLAFIQKNAPGLEYGLIPFISAVDGQPSVSAVTGSFWVIPTGCQHPDEAWEFLSWLIAPAQSSRFAARLHNIPPLRAALSDSRYQDVYNSRMRFFIDFLLDGRGRSLPALPIGQFFYNEFNDTVEQICAGNLSPEDGLGRLEWRLQKELDRSLRHMGIAGDAR